MHEDLFFVSMSIKFNRNLVTNPIFLQVLFLEGEIFEHNNYINYIIRISFPNV